MATLAERILQLTSPAPTFQDSDEIDELTAAQVIEKSDKDEGEENVSASSSKLRKQAVSLLADEDERYAGKKVSRKRLQEEEIDKDDVSSNEEEDVNEEDEDDKIATFTAKMKAASSELIMDSSSNDDEDSQFEESEDDSDNGEDSSEDNDTDQDEGEGSEEEDLEEKDEDENGISHFSSTSVEAEVKKGEATKMQLTLWDELLKSRIELQKVALQVNQLPQPDVWTHFTQQGGADYGTALSKGQVALNTVLDRLFELQTRLLVQNPETSALSESPTCPQRREGDSDDGSLDEEEITSESEVEDHQTQDERRRKCKHKLEDYPEVLAKRHKAFHTYRNDTIQKWYDKTRVATGKINRGFNAFDQSALKQIEQILTDKDRLVKRTQLKRSTYRILGKRETGTQGDEETTPQDEITQPQVSGRDKDYDIEIFDDNDFYHQLLREFIDRKAIDMKDPFALSRHWLALQTMRKKAKRKVDTRASKGRKLRYDIYPKLVNFMPPADTAQWTDEAIDDLYSSLFGKHEEAKEEVM